MLAFLTELPRRVVGINRRNVDLIYPLNPRQHFPIADDKILTKEYMQRAEVLTPKTFAICSRLGEVPTTLEQIANLDELVIKPASGSQGSGIIVIAGRREGVHVGPNGKQIPEGLISRHLAEIVFGTYSKDRPDRALVEERLVAHPTLAQMSAGGLPDLRIIVLSGRAQMAMLRVATGESGGRANLHQGGIGLAVDLQSGEVTRAMRRGKAVELHPDSGVPLVGAHLPIWDQVVETAERACAALPFDFVGVDLIVDAQDRVLVIEVNVRPGLEIQNVHGVGLLEVMR